MGIERKNRVTALLSIDELAQLQRLADDEGVPATQLLRALIKRSYTRRFGEDPARPTPATVRGLIDDLTGRAHYTTWGVAERMGVSPDALLAKLQRLAKARIVALEATHSNKDTTWHSLFGNRDATIAALETKGIDPEEPVVTDE